MRFDGLIKLRGSDLILERDLVRHQVVVHLRILLQRLITDVV